MRAVARAQQSRGEKCGLDQIEAAARALSGPGGERCTARRAGDLRRVVVDHRCCGMTLRDAGVPIPVIPQHPGRAFHITACDRKPEP